jgi:regulator of replication initiation timing
MASDADNSDILEMSNEDLMTEWTSLGDEAQAIRERLKAFSAEHQRRVEAERIQRVLGDMTPEQKEAAKHAIDVAPEPIESEESVGDEA